MITTHLFNVHCHFFIIWTLPGLGKLQYLQTREKKQKFHSSNYIFKASSASISTSLPKLSSYVKGIYRQENKKLYNCSCQVWQTAANHFELTLGTVDQPESWHIDWNIGIHEQGFHVLLYSNTRNRLKNNMIFLPQHQNICI